MRALTAEDVLSIWERSSDRHPVDQALALLSAAFPEADPDALADLPLGARDARLAALRIRMFDGPALGSAACPSCGERAEFALPAADVARAADERVEAVFDAEIDGRRFVVALPTSRTVAACVTASSTDVARRRLVESCIVGERDERGDVAPIATLSPDVERRLGEAIAERDPWSDVRLGVACTVCGASFEVAYDPGRALWAEIAAKARRLLFEVDALARAYGWSERAILGMSTRRRHAYLTMVGA